MSITAQIVKELRERTGAGMMDCKRALQEADGNIEKAIDIMRKSGVANAAKKTGRVAAEGSITVRLDEKSTRIVIVEINSETDFVAKDENFKHFCEVVADCILANLPSDVDALMAATMPDSNQTIEESHQQLVTKIGENISVRRFSVFHSSENKVLGSYLHGTRIGVLVELENGDAATAKDIAMHIAASNPMCINEQDIPGSVIDREKEIFTAQAKESGRSAEIMDKIVEGRIRKFIKEVALLQQPFIKDDKQTVAQLLKQSEAMVSNYIRYEVGEGLDKKDDNFAEEVMAQVKGK